MGNNESDEITLTLYESTTIELNRKLKRGREILKNIQKGEQNVSEEEREELKEMVEELSSDLECIESEVCNDELETHKTEIDLFSQHTEEVRALYETIILGSDKWEGLPNDPCNSDLAEIDISERIRKAEVFKLREAEASTPLSLTDAFPEGI